MVGKSDFGQREVSAGRSVLVELIHILGEFKDAVVVIGGSVPPLLYPKAANEYVGTLDVDLAINHNVVTDETYHTILETLTNRGYKPHKDQPFIFFREVPMDDGDPVVVQVDLLSGEYGGTGKSRRTQKFQDINTRKARGSDLVFDNFIEVEIEETLPGGGKDKVTCKVAAIIPFVVMKGIALGGRLKEKDAYDIYFCIKNNPGDLDNLVREFRPYIQNNLVKEGLEIIKDKFASPDHIGPKHIADFEEIADEEERARIQRDAYERIDYLIKKLGV